MIAIVLLLKSSSNKDTGMTNFVKLSLNSIIEISLISKYKCNLKALLRQGISQQKFYGDVIYKLRKIVEHTHFNSLFIKRIKKFNKKGYDPTILQRTACLVVNPFTVGHHASLFACATTGRSKYSMKTTLKSGNGRSMSDICIMLVLSCP